MRLLPLLLLISCGAPPPPPAVAPWRLEIEGLQRQYTAGTLDAPGRARLAALLDFEENASGQAGAVDAPLDDVGRAQWRVMRAWERGDRDWAQRARALAVAQPAEAGPMVGLLRLGGEPAPATSSAWPRAAEPLATALRWAAQPTPARAAAWREAWPRDATARLAEAFSARLDPELPTWLRAARSANALEAARRLCPTCVGPGLPPRPPPLSPPVEALGPRDFGPPTETLYRQTLLRFGRIQRRVVHSVTERPVQPPEGAQVHEALLHSKGGGTRPARVASGRVLYPRGEGLHELLYALDEPAEDGLVELLGPQAVSRSELIVIGEGLDLRPLGLEPPWVDTWRDRVRATFARSPAPARVAEPRAPLGPRVWVGRALQKAWLDGGRAVASLGPPPEPAEACARVRALVRRPGGMGPVAHAINARTGSRALVLRAWLGPGARLLTHPAARPLVRVGEGDAARFFDPDQPMAPCEATAQRPSKGWLDERGDPATVPPGALQPWRWRFDFEGEGPRLRGPFSLKATGVAAEALFAQLASLEPAAARAALERLLARRVGAPKVTALEVEAEDTGLELRGTLEADRAGLLSGAFLLDLPERPLLSVYAHGPERRAALELSGAEEVIEVTGVAGAPAVLEALEGRLSFSQSMEGGVLRRQTRLRGGSVSAARHAELVEWILGVSSRL